MKKYRQIFATCFLIMEKSSGKKKGRFVAFRKRKHSNQIVKAHKRLDGMVQKDTEKGAVIN